MVKTLNYGVRSQARRKNRSSVEAEYDTWVVEQYRAKYPREVKKIEQELIKHRPSLAKNRERLWRLTNREIMPPVSDKADGFFWSSGGRTHGGFHFRIDLCNDITYHKEEKNVEEEVQTMIVKDLLESIPVEDSELVQAAYGFEPYTDRMTFEELSAEFNIPLGHVRTRIKEAIRKLRNAYVQNLNNGIQND